MSEMAILRQQRRVKCSTREASQSEFDEAIDSLRGGAVGPDSQMLSNLYRDWRAVFLGRMERHCFYRGRYFFHLLKSKTFGGLSLE
jgi:hypothetical protein